MKIENEMILEKSTKFEHYMLPPQFRKRSNIIQRIKLIGVFLLHSFAMSFIIYGVLDNIKIKLSINNNIKTHYFLTLTVAVVLLMAIVCFFVYWSKPKIYFITWTDFILYTIFPLTIISGSIYLNSVNNLNLLKFLEITGIIIAISGAIIVSLVLIRNIMISKKYREAKYRTVYTALGTLLFLLLPYLFYLIISKNNLKELPIGSLLLLIGFFIGAIVFATIGLVLSSKYMIFAKKNIWYTFRYNSGLSSIFTYCSLLTFAIKNLKNFTFVSALIIQLIICLMFLFLWIAHLFVRARIKNISKTNPLFNEIYLKLFIIFVLAITLVMIFVLPNMSQQKSYSGSAFIILAIGAINILVGIFMAHFFNLITFSKYEIFSFLGTIASTLLIFAITLSIASLKNSWIISQILGRQIVILFIVICLVLQLITLLLNITYIFLNIVKKKKRFLDNPKISKENIQKTNPILKGSA